MLETSNLILR